MNRNKNYTKGAVKPAVKNEQNVPEHLKNIVLLLKNNAEIRRYTALGMINRLKQAGQIAKEAKVYINFYFTKFSINIDGLKQEFHYNSELFINCLAAAFPAFANSASKIINEFCKIESKEIEEEEINDISNNIINNDSSWDGEE